MWHLNKYICSLLGNISTHIFCRTKFACVICYFRQMNVDSLLMFQQNNQTEDLIRLDSVSDLDDFDPLKSPSKQTSTNSAPLSLSNPLYTYENQLPRQNGGISMISQNTIQQSQNLLEQNTKNIGYNTHDQDLLHEYGLDFGFSSNRQISNQNSFDEFGTTKVNSQGQWTKFD